ncbi:hypothetical protein MPSEU_000720900 [Mayamaea pseudoterrestris]|nr:hypothetical protein MPSEU_000720900 [Mayamaea pseudoterrestris]
MDHLPLIVKESKNPMSPPFAVDAAAGPSPICGPTALTKLMRKSKEAVSASNASGRMSPLDELNRSSMVIGSNAAAPLALFQSKLSYEEVDDPFHTPHEVDTASSSGSDKSLDMFLNAPVSFFPQFCPSTPTGQEMMNEKEALNVNKNKASSPGPKTPNRPRTSSWSSTLAAVTEETSFDELSRDASSNEQQIPPEKAKPTAVEEEQQMLNPQPTNPGFEMPTEKKEMVGAMRNLIIKQQYALKELADQNANYRKRIVEYQTKLIDMKKEAVNCNARINELILEKDALTTDCMWLHEELRSLQHERGRDLNLAKGEAENDVTSSALASINSQSRLKEKTDNVGEKEYDDDEDDSLRLKFKELMTSHVAGPTSTGQLLLPPDLRTTEAFAADASENTWENLQLAPRSTTNECMWENGSMVVQHVAEKKTGAVTKNEMKEEPFRDSTLESTNELLLLHDPGSAFSPVTASECFKGSTDSINSSSCGMASRSREEAKEEMAKYKSRLESIQKKRIERRNGSQACSRPMVRFDASSGLK